MSLGRCIPQMVGHRSQTTPGIESIRAASKPSSRHRSSYGSTSSAVTTWFSSLFGGLLVAPLRCRSWKISMKACKDKERYSNLPDGIRECVSNPIYGIVDSHSQRDLYDTLLRFISLHGEGESWEIRQSANPDGVMEVNAQPGLGWHLSDWKGQKIRSFHFERDNRQIAIFIEGGSKKELLHFFQSCKEMHIQQAEEAEVAEDPIEVSKPKFWVQELVEAALREEADENREEASSRRWNELKREEADKLGAKRLGLDFDPLAPS